MITFNDALTITEFTDLILGGRPSARIPKSLIAKIDLTDNENRETWLTNFHVEELLNSDDVRLWLVEDWKRESRITRFRNHNDIIEQVKVRDQLKREALDYIIEKMGINEAQAKAMLTTILSTAAFAKSMSDSLGYSFDKLITTHRRLSQAGTIDSL